MIDGRWLDEIGITTIISDVEILRNHFANKELWFGKRSSQTATKWAEENSLIPFRAVSGNGDFGSDLNDEALVIGSEDTPIYFGGIDFKVSRITIVESSQTPPYALRFIWGNGTMADAIIARQYTSLILTFDNFASVPFGLVFPKISNGYKVWAQAKHSVNNATLDFFIGSFGFGE
jgi:hypothetical protein